MIFTKESLFKELAIFLFYHREFQHALDHELLKIQEDQILDFFKGCSRTGGMFTTQPVNGIYRIIGYYEFTTKGVTISIPITEGSITKFKKFSYAWELIVESIITISSSKYKQLTLF